MTFKTLAVSTAAVLSLTLGLAFAQGPHPRAGNHNPVEMLSRVLDLTDSQKAAATAIFDQAKQDSQPIADQLKQSHQAIAAAVKAQKSDVELSDRANASGRLMGELAAVHVKSMAHVYALLTPEQRAKADQLHDHFGGMFQSRFGMRP
jgi:Spy/CpxP family protein refolding chaperone